MLTFGREEIYPVVDNFRWSRNYIMTCWSRKFIRVQSVHFGNCCGRVLHNNFRFIRALEVGTGRCGAGTLMHGNTAAGPPLPHGVFVLSEELTHGEKENFEHGI